MEAEHDKAMSDVLLNAAKNYGDLEKKHFETIALMKDAEEKVRTESKMRTKIEAELVLLQDKVKNLEAECVRSIGEAREEGKREGEVEGKHEVLGDVKNQIQGVYNRSFRDGWKVALRKVDTPASLDLLLRENTPLPYPDAGLRESDKEDGDEEEDEDEEDEVQEIGSVEVNPVLIPADNPLALASSDPIDSVLIPTENPPAPADAASSAEI
jgi:hypothetical protein